MTPSLTSTQKLEIFDRVHPFSLMFSLSCQPEKELLCMHLSYNEVGKRRDFFHFALDRVLPRIVCILTAETPLVVRRLFEMEERINVR